MDAGARDHLVSGLYRLDELFVILLLLLLRADEEEIENDEYSC